MIGNRYETIVNEWKRKPLKSIADIDTALDNFRVLFAYNSNKIENPETTYHGVLPVKQTIEKTKSFCIWLNCQIFFMPPVPVFFYGIR